MTPPHSPPPAPPAHYTLFVGHRRLASGTLQALHDAAAGQPADAGPLLAFDDHTGAQVDFDPRALQAPPPPPRPPGRPKLGVVAREVTLLPRHWEWLSAQPGGASVALRKLVEEARRSPGAQDGRRAAQERCYRFLSAIAGNLPQYEEALRALFAQRRDAFQAAMDGWPQDIRGHALTLSDGAFEPPTA